MYKISWKFNKYSQIMYEFVENLNFVFLFFIHDFVL